MAAGAAIELRRERADFGGEDRIVTIHDRRLQPFEQRRVALAQEPQRLAQFPAAHVEIVGNGSLDHVALALLTILFSGIVITAVFVTGSGLRFQSWLIPLWLVLGAHGVRMLAAFLLDPVRLGAQRQALQHALGVVLIGGVVLSWSPWRLFDSYTTRMQTDSTGALSYVRRNARAGDAIMVSAPHTQSALLEIGRVDYDLAIPLLHDFFYRKDGRLIDRNAGAEAIRNVDMLQETCVKHERLWVLVNREDILRSPGKDIRWRLPGGRADLFLRTNLELTYRTYLWDVFLWDAASGRLHAFRHNR